MSAVEILTKEIGVEYIADIERPAVLFAYLRQLLGHFEHDMEVRKMLGQKPSAHVGRFLERLHQLCDGNLSADDSAREAEVIAGLLHEVHDEEAYPADRDMEFLSGITCAVRFSFEAPRISRWPAEVGNDLFKRHYGFTLFDSNTSRWSKEWLRDRFNDGLRALANAEKPVEAGRDRCGAQRASSKSPVV